MHLAFVDHLPKHSRVAPQSTLILCLAVMGHHGQVRLILCVVMSEATCPISGGIGTRARIINYSLFEGRKWISCISVS
jgi:hypothetical protein